MRSIGKVKIKKLKTIVMNAFDNDRYVTEEEIVAMLPVSWWDTWESTDAEIRRIINDELENLIGALLDDL